MVEIRHLNTFCTRLSNNYSHTYSLRDCDIMTCKDVEVSAGSLLKFLICFRLNFSALYTNSLSKFTQGMIEFRMSYYFRPYNDIENALKHRITAIQATHRVTTKGVVVQPPRPC